MTDNREVIVSTVEEEKALSFTELKEMTGLSNGVLQYHIRDSEEVLHKRGAVLYKGVCESCDYREACEKKCIVKELKKDRTQKVLSLLEEGRSQADVARELDLTRPTVHYHVEKLRDMDLIES
jgi:radical SAM protein with 4Fe4S-binding SPASM domain